MSREPAWLIVPVFDSFNNINKLIECLKAQTYKDFCLIIVNHGKEQLDLKEKDIQLEVIKGNPRMWWTAAVNHGIRYILENKRTSLQTPIIIQNDDVTFNQDYLYNLINSWRYREDVIMGSVCLDEDTGRILRANLVLNKRKALFEDFYKGESLSLITDKGILASDLLTGRGTLIPVKVLKSAGLFREKRPPHYRADYELVLRAKKKGFQAYVSANAFVYTRIVNHHKHEQNKLQYLYSYKSRINIKDLFFFSYSVFNIFYATYFFIVNLKRIAKIVSRSE